MARSLAERGHNVRVCVPRSERRTPINANVLIRQVPYLLSPTWERTFDGPIPEFLEGLSSSKRSTTKETFLRATGLLSFPLGLAHSLRHELQVSPPDLVISHFGLPCAFVTDAVLRTFRHRPRHLAVWHSGDVALCQQLSLAPLARRLQAEHWCVTRTARDRLGLCDAFVCPMGAEDPLEGPLRAPIPPGPQKRVLFVGRLERIKGVDVLLHASAKRNYDLWIAGDGSQRNELELLTKQLGYKLVRSLDSTFGAPQSTSLLSSKKKQTAYFFGQVTPSQRNLLLRSADAFALPSRPVTSSFLGARVEGAPAALLEAQLAGLPIAASKTGGLYERIEHEVDGLLVEPNSPVALGSAIERALNAPEFGQQARANNLRYTWKTLSGVIEQFAK